MISTSNKNILFFEKFVILDASFYIAVQRHGIKVGIISESPIDLSILTIQLGNFGLNIARF
jgi:hypothetical protein